MRPVENLYVLLTVHAQYDSGAIQVAGPMLAEFLRTRGLKATILVAAGPEHGSKICTRHMKGLWDEYWEIGCEPGLHMHVESKADYCLFISKRLGRVEEFAEFVRRVKAQEEDEAFIREEFSKALKRLEEVGVSGVGAFAAGDFRYKNFHTGILEAYGIGVIFSLPGHLSINRDFEGVPDEPYYISHEDHRIPGGSKVLRIPIGWDGVPNYGLSGYQGHYLQLGSESIWTLISILERYHAKALKSPERPVIIGTYWHYMDQDINKLQQFVTYAEKLGVHFVTASEAKRIWTGWEAKGYKHLT